MLKLVNRTRSQGSRFTFCTDLRDVASRIPPACPPIILSFLSFSFPFSLSTTLLCLSFLRSSLVSSAENPPPQTPWLRQWRARIVFVVYRFLRLPSTRRRVHPSSLPFPAASTLSLSLPLSFSCTSSPDLRRRPCGGFRRATFALPVWNLLTALVCARDRSPASLDRGHAVGVLGFFDTPAVLLPFERPGATLAKRSIR